MNKPIMGTLSIALLLTGCANLTSPAREHSISFQMLRVYPLVLMLAVFLASCVNLPPKYENIARVPSVRLSMVWSIDGPDAMVSRTIALERQLEKVGFSVTRLAPGYPASAPIYPNLFVSVQHDRNWCLGGVFYVYSTAETKQGFELYQRGDADIERCSAGIVEQLLMRVRPH